MPLGNKEITRRFESHPVDEATKADIDTVTAKFKTLASWIDKNVKNPREAASALTHLEQGKFFTVAGLSRPVVEGTFLVTAAPKTGNKAVAPTPGDVAPRKRTPRKAAASVADPTPALATPAKRGPRRPAAK